jgi:dTDP-4-dehydrorhamnose 3,5-epimerase-like enzyme
MCASRSDQILAPFAGRVGLIPLRGIVEARGRLVEIDHAKLPFAVRRSFLVDRVPDGTVRGGHAHRHCQQVLICLQGRVLVDLKTNNDSAEVMLTDSAEGLFIDAGIWSAQRYEAGARLLVLASHPFDPNSYVDAT